MTKEKAAELLPVMEAFAKGGAVQYRRTTSGGWRDCEDPCFDPNWQWQIKPAPREFWIVWSGSTYKLKEMYAQIFTTCPDLPANQLIHVREVTEEK